MKRFYDRAAAVADADAFRIELDGRPVRTPAGAFLVIPSGALADAIAAEWQAQGETVAPREMPLTGLANAAIDRVRPARETILATIASFAATDLVLYRADEPPELVARQEAAWQPLVDWTAARYGARFRVTRGVMPIVQPAEAVEALRTAVSATDDFTLAGLHVLTTATGSLTIALAVAESRMPAAEAAAVSQLDELWQAELWGEDPEAVRRRAALGVEIAAAARFLSLLAAEA